MNTKCSSSALQVCLFSWGELNTYLKVQRAFCSRGNWAAFGLHCVYLPQKPSDPCLGHLFTDVGNDQIWKENLHGLIHQQVQKPNTAHSHSVCSPGSGPRPLSCCYTRSLAAIASPTPSPSPLSVIPDLDFAFCSNKENVFKTLLTLMQREAVIDTVTAGEWVRSSAELSVPLLFSAANWKQLREGRRSRSFCNDPPGTWTNLWCCRVCTIGKTGNSLREDNDKIPHLNLVSISSTFIVITRQWSTFKLHFKKTSKEMREGNMWTSRANTGCAERENNVVIAPRPVLVSLTLMGVVKHLLKGLFLLGFVTVKSECVSSASSDQLSQVPSRHAWFRAAVWYLRM